MNSYVEKLETQGFAILENVIDNVIISELSDSLGKISLNPAVSLRGNDAFGIRELLNGNRYHFALNHPLKYADPDGRHPGILVALEAKGKQIAAGAAIGAVIGGGIELGRQLYNGGEIDKQKIGASVLSGGIYGATIGATNCANLVYRFGVPAAGNVIGGIVERALDGDDTTVPINPNDALTDAISGAMGGGATKAYERYGANWITKKILGRYKYVRQPQRLAWLKRNVRNKREDEIAWARWVSRQLENAAAGISRGAAKWVGKITIEYYLNPPEEKDKAKDKKK